MSAFGISPGDFTLLAKAIYTLYDSYKNGPQRVQGMVDGLKDLAMHAKSLKSVLDVANISTCPPFEGFEKLTRDLQEASLFLQKNKEYTGSSKTWKRLVGATALTVQQGDLTSWHGRLADHRSRLESYKSLLILHALSNNHRADQPTSSNSNDVTDTDEEVLDRAIRVLQHRRQSINSPVFPPLTPGEQSFRSGASTLISPRSESQRICKEVVARAEALNLHCRDHAPSENPEAWEEIIDQLARISSDQRASAKSTGFSLGPMCQSPEILKKTSTADDITGCDDLVLRYWAQPQSPKNLRISPILPVLPESSANISCAAVLELLPVVSIDDDDGGGGGSLHETSPAQTLPCRKRVQLHSKILEKHFAQDWIDVQLEVSRDGNGLSLRAIAQDLEVPAKKMTPIQRGLMPRDLLRPQPYIDSVAPQASFAVHKHSIQHDFKSYPVVHHPAVENGKHDIEFFDQQITEIENISTYPERHTDIIYRFDDPVDRDMVRATIFGKRLLASAGYDNVQPGGVCDFQTLTIWADYYDDDDDNGDNHSTSDLTKTLPTLYASFPSNPKGRQSGPEGCSTFKITGCRNIDAAQKKGNRLVLEVDPVQVGPESMKIRAARCCKVLLSEQSEACKQDKKNLLRVLGERFIKN